eukprot:3508518-Rhodomonas_salina.1
MAQVHLGVVALVDSQAGSVEQRVVHAAGLHEGIIGSHQMRGSRRHRGSRLVEQLTHLVLRETQERSDHRHHSLANL